MIYTHNYGLALYQGTDKMNITGASNSLNSNFEKVDSELKNVNNRTDNIVNDIVPQIERTVSEKAEKSDIPDVSNFATRQDLGIIKLEKHGDGVLVCNNVGMIVNINSATSTGDSWHSLDSCVQNELFIISGLGGSTGRLYAVLDKDYKVIECSAASLKLERKVIKIPSNGAYLLVNHFRDMEYQSYRVDEESTTPVITKKIIEKSVTGKIDKLLPKERNLDIEVYGYATNANGEFVVSGNGAYTSLIEVKDGDAYQIQYNRKSNVNNRLHGYDEDGKWIKQIAQIASSDVTPLGIHKYEFEVDDGIKFIRLSCGKEDIDISLIRIRPDDDAFCINADSEIVPLAPYVSKVVSSESVLSIAKAIGMHTIPRSLGVLNVVRRAYQMTDCKWTPAVDIPRAMMGTGDTYLTSHSSVIQGFFVSGVEYTGLPYDAGSDRHVGTRNALDVFFTSVCNPESVESKESAVSSDGGTYYGTACTGLTAYCLDIPEVSSRDYAYIPGMNLQYALVENGMRHSIDDLSIGDILQIDGHCAIVTDLMYDGDTPIRIEVSEQTRQGAINRSKIGVRGSVCRRFWMTRDQFYTWFDGFNVYRYDFIDETTYTPNPYSPLANEGRIYGDDVDLPLVPYMGNKSTYSIASGSYSIKLLIADEVTGYNYVVVEKDGALFTTIPVNAQTKITVSCDSTEGRYTAHLEKRNASGAVTVSSMSCVWGSTPYVSPSRMSYDSTRDETSFEITFKRDDWKPYFIQDAREVTPSGASVAKHRVFEKDLTKRITSSGVTYAWKMPGHYVTGYTRMGIKSDEFGIRERSI